MIKRKIRPYMSHESQVNVTRGEFQQFQTAMLSAFETVRDDMKSVVVALNQTSSDSREHYDRLQKSTKPNLQLIIMGLSLVLAIVLAIGGLVAFGFKSEIAHTQSSIASVAANNLLDIHENRERIDYLYRREISELDDRRKVERDNLKKP